MSEKLTLNVGVIELGQIDVLVSEGFYQNRTDFMRTAIRQMLLNHSDNVKQATHRKMMTLGAVLISRQMLEKAKAKEEMLDIRTVGLIHVDPDVTPELAAATISRLSCYGVLRIPAPVKQALAGRIH